MSTRRVTARSVSPNYTSEHARKDGDAGALPLPHVDSNRAMTMSPVPAAAAVSLRSATASPATHSGMQQARAHVRDLVSKRPRAPLPSRSHAYARADTRVKTPALVGNSSTASPFAATAAEVHEPRQSEKAARQHADEAASRLWSDLQLSNEQYSHSVNERFAQRRRAVDDALGELRKLLEHRCSSELINLLDKAWKASSEDVDYLLHVVSTQAQQVSEQEEEVKRLKQGYQDLISDLQMEKAKLKNKLGETEQALEEQRRDSNALRSQLQRRAAAVNHQPAQHKNHMPHDDTNGAESVVPDDPAAPLQAHASYATHTE